MENHKKNFREFLDECEKETSPKLVSCFASLVCNLEKVESYLVESNQEAVIEKEIKAIGYDNAIKTIKKALLDLPEEKFVYLFSELRKTVGMGLFKDYLEKLAIDRIILFPVICKPLIPEWLEPLQPYRENDILEANYILVRNIKKKFCLIGGKMTRDGVFYNEEAKKIIYRSLATYMKIKRRLVVNGLIIPDYSAFTGKTVEKNKFVLSEYTMEYMLTFFNQNGSKLSVDTISLFSIDFQKEGTWEKLIKLLHLHFETEKIENIEFVICDLSDNIDLNQLPGVKVLKISYCNTVDEVGNYSLLFENLKQLPSLQRLVIEGVEHVFSEDAFVAFLSSLEALPNIQEVVIPNNKLGTKKVAETLKVLEKKKIISLDISGNAIDIFDKYFISIRLSIRDMAKDMLSLKVTNHFITKK